MPVPSLPNELVTAILEELWLELAVDPLSGDLYPPINACALFCPLLRVNKTWYHLVLPYTIAHVNARRLDYVIEVLEKHHLSRAIRSLDFGPQLYVGNMKGSVVCTALVEEQQTRWAPVLSSLNRVQQLRMEATTSQNLPVLLDGKDTPWQAFLRVWDVGRLPTVWSLCLELEPKTPFSEFTQLLRNLPNLAKLSLTIYSFAAPEGSWSPSPSTAESLPPLRHLEIKVRRRKDLEQVMHGLVAPSSSTLQHLVMVRRRNKLRNAPPASLSTLFPFSFQHLRYLRLTGRFLLDTPSPWLDAPELEELDLWVQIGDIPVFPPTVQRLTLVLERWRFRQWLADGEIDAFLSMASLRALILDTNNEGEDDYSYEEPFQRDREDLKRVVNLAAERGIRLLGSLSPSALEADTSTGVLNPRSGSDAAAVPDHGGDFDADESSDIKGSDDAASESDESAYEDDWDAEGDPFFEPFWSDEKKKEFEEDSGTFSSLPPSPPSLLPSSCTSSFFLILDRSHPSISLPISRPSFDRFPHARPSFRHCRRRRRRNREEGGIVRRERSLRRCSERRIRRMKRSCRVRPFLYLSFSSLSLTFSSSPSLNFTSL
jgi:hypothetical protein